jgi:hypothetical protein
LSALAEEDLLAAQLLGGGKRRVQAAKDIELRSRREVQQRLELAHEVNLTATLENVDPLLGRDDRVTVEVGRALLELREVLDALQRALRAEQPLDVHSTQAGRFARSRNEKPMF